MTDADDRSTNDDLTDDYDPNDLGDLQCGMISSTRSAVCILNPGHGGMHRVFSVTTHSFGPRKPIPFPDLENINPGIRETVRLLNQNGFRTTDSGDGKTGDYSCDRPYPYVSIASTRAGLIQDADDIAFLFSEHGVQVGELTEEGEGPYIQAMYTPQVKNCAIIDIQNVDDKLLGLVP